VTANITAGETMHPEALTHARLFFETYLPVGAGRTVVEIGSQDVNGSLRDVAPGGCNYVGVDFVAGKGVDVVLTDPYRFPFADNHADAVVTSSCFEHCQFFWITFLETMRIVKPDGLVYVNAPSGGVYHRYPTDNWRFYPDAGLALNAWAKVSGYDSSLLESFIGWQNETISNDFVAVFLKDRSAAARHPQRMFKRALNPTNVFVDDAATPEQRIAIPQDQRRWTYFNEALRSIVTTASRRDLSGNAEAQQLVEALVQLAGRIRSI
jgi:SAM-dependent methyltransferase